MVYAIINSSFIQQWGPLIIIIGFAVFGAVKGIYGIVTPVLSVIVAILTGIALSGRVNSIAGSRFLTFIVISAIAWGVLRLLVKLGEKVSNWFVIGWINHITGFIAGLIIGYTVESFIFGIIKFFGGNIV